MGHALGRGQLQVRLDAKSLNHARYLHDMLVPFVPILIALSANSPIYKGQLSEHDHSHEVFSRMTNDIDEQDQASSRTARFSSPASHYISNHEYVKEYHNDQVNSVSQNPAVYELLESTGTVDDDIDERLKGYLASHAAFRKVESTREAKMMFQEKDAPDISDQKLTELLESDLHGI